MLTALRQGLHGAVGRVLAPTILSPAFLHRIILFRLTVLALSLYEIDQVALHIAIHVTPWGLADRLLLLVMVAPMLASLVGLAMPFIALAIYERHWATIHDLILNTCVVSKALLHLSGRLWVRADPKQHLLLDAVLFCIHQDGVQEYTPKLAVMLAVYSLGSTLQSAGARAAGDEGRGAASGPVSAYSYITAGEYYVCLLLMALVVSRLYGYMMGPREQPLFLRQVALNMRSASQRAWPAAQRTKQKLEQQQTTASSAYLWKLATVKGTQALTLLSYAARQAMAVSSWDGSGKLTSAVIAGAGGGILGLSVVVSLTCTDVYQRWSRAINGAALLACASARIALLLLEGGEAEHAVFHHFMAICFSLLVNEEPFGAFAAQLGAFCLAFKGVQAAADLAGHPRSFGSAMHSLLLDRVEFYFLGAVCCGLHSFVSVGKWSSSEDGDRAAKQAAARAAATSLLAAQHAQQALRSATPELGNSTSAAVPKRASFGDEVQRQPMSPSLLSGVNRRERGGMRVDRCAAAVQRLAANTQGQGRDGGISAVTSGAGEGSGGGGVKEELEPQLCDWFLHSTTDVPPVSASDLAFQISDLTHEATAMSREPNSVQRLQPQEGWSGPAHAALANSRRSRSFSDLLTGRASVGSGYHGADLATCAADAVSELAFPDSCSDMRRRTGSTTHECELSSHNDWSDIFGRSSPNLPPTVYAERSQTGMVPLPAFRSTPGDGQSAQAQQALFQLAQSTSSSSVAVHTVAAGSGDACRLSGAIPMVHPGAHHKDALRRRRAGPLSSLSPRHASQVPLDRAYPNAAGSHVRTNTHLGDGGSDVSTADSVPTASTAGLGAAGEGLHRSVSDASVQLGNRRASAPSAHLSQPTSQRRSGPSGSAPSNAGVPRRHLTSPMPGSRVGLVAQEQERHERAQRQHQQEGWSPASSALYAQSSSDAAAGGPRSPELTNPGHQPSLQQLPSPSVTLHTVSPNAMRVGGSPISRSITSRPSFSHTAEDLLQAATAVSVQDMLALVELGVALLMCTQQLITLILQCPLRHKGAAFAMAAAEVPGASSARCLLPAAVLGLHLAVAATHVALTLWGRSKGGAAPATTAPWPMSGSRVWSVLLRFVLSGAVGQLALAVAGVRGSLKPLHSLQIAASAFAVHGFTRDECLSALTLASGLHYAAHVLGRLDAPPVRLLLDAAVFFTIPWMVFASIVWANQLLVSSTATACLKAALQCAGLPASMHGVATGLAVLLALLACFILPVLLDYQSRMLQVLHAGLHALDIRLASHSGGASSVVLVAVPLFVAVAVVQSLLLRASLTSDPRRRWYEKQHAKLLGFMDGLLVCDGSNEAIVASLRQATSGAFDSAGGSQAAPACGGGAGSGCVVMELVVLEGGASSVEDTTAVVYVVHGLGEGLPVRSLPCHVLHSVRHALSHQVVLYTNNLHESAPEAHYEDWQLMSQTCGAVSVVTVPLLYGGCDLGALVVSCPKAGAWDELARKLVMDFGLQLSQALYTTATQRELAAGEAVLTDMVPGPVAELLKRKARHDEGGGDGGAPGSALVYKQWHPAVSVLFADIVGYTTLSQSVEPEEVMMMLHALYCKYDALCTVYGVYKVETIGDCWMGATGLLAEDPRHASVLVAFGRDMFRAAAAVRDPSTGKGVRIRVGIHSGRVMSGIVGSIRARYCLFGDCVNTASRMESTGVPGCVQVSNSTHELLEQGEQLAFEARGAIQVKGKGEVVAWLYRSCEYDGTTTQP